MATNNSNKKQVKNQVPKQHHYARTLIASFFGILALWLVLASIIIVWFNRTVTDTNTYVSTVSPVITRPEVQNFFADRLSDQIYKNASVQDVAQTLLPATQTAGQSMQQLQTQVDATVHTSVVSVLNSQSFKKLWEDSNRSAHQQLISQIRSNNTELNLDLNPALLGLIAELKQTSLSPVTDKLTVTTDTARVTLKGEGIVKVHRAYVSLQQATVFVLLLSLIAFALAVVISVHHGKTVRRIALSTGIALLLIALFMQLTSLITFSGEDKNTQAFALVLARTLGHNLQLASFIIGLFLVLAAVGSKVYTIVRPRTS